MSANLNGNRELGMVSPITVFKDWMPLIVLFIGAITWGMKLESAIARGEQDELAMLERVVKLEAAVGRGILPRAEEKFEANSLAIREVDRRLSRLEVKIDGETKK